MTLTPLDRRAMRRSFDQAAGGYDAVAVLQQEVASRTLERVDYFDLDPDRVLDIGCGTGKPSLELARRFPGSRVLCVDWAPSMLSQARRHNWQGPGDVTGLCADMHQLPLAARSMDLVFSNLALQWSADLPGWMAQVRRVLKPGGLLVFSTFGPDTLFELRESWAAVDQHSHVNRFIDMHDIGDQMVAAGFRDPVMDTERLVLHYQEVITLMRELKAIGARNVATSRPDGLTGRGHLNKLLDAYEHYRTADGYPASYEVVYGVAIAPPDGQPIRTGGGEVATFSLDALKRRS